MWADRKLISNENTRLYKSSIRIPAHYQKALTGQDTYLPRASCLGWDEVTESQGVIWEIQARQSKPRLSWHGSPYPAVGSLKYWMSSDPVYAYSVADKAHRTDCLGHSFLSCRFSEKVYFLCLFSLPTGIIIILYGYLMIINVKHLEKYQG